MASCSLVHIDVFQGKKHFNGLNLFSLMKLVLFSETKGGHLLLRHPRSSGVLLIYQTHPLCHVDLCLILKFICFTKITFNFKIVFICVMEVT